MRQAKSVIPGGVNSPVRAFGSVGGDPIFFDRGQGPYLYDLDANKYIDYVGSWGPIIVGHAHPEVLAAISNVMARGLSFGAPTEGETKLAFALRELYPSMERVRLVSSGTEACMSALRLARAFTKRSKIVKFTGCYHGHADMLLVKAGSGALTLGLPDSPGVPEDAARHTVVSAYNDVAGLAQVFKDNPKEIAAIIMEHIVGKAGFIRPSPEFMNSVFDLAHAHGALVIFDEVMTGSRVGVGGVQGNLGLKPDITTLGKVIGGGLPLAAYGGRSDIMAMVAPEGSMYQAGTLSGNPLAVASGLKTLEIIRRPGAFSGLTKLTQKLVTGLKQAAERQGIPFSVDAEGGMFGFFFHKGPVRSLEEAKASDIASFKAFFHNMLKRGIYLAPSPFEAGFVSLAHTEKDIDWTVECAEWAFKDLKS